MRPIFALILLIAIQSLHAQEMEPIVLGSRHTLSSTILNETREYWVSLPESYDEKEAAQKHYPVLLVLDGHLHFKPIAGMVHYLSADRYRSQKIPEMIVVGIQNIDRRRDFTPDKVVTVRPNNTGGGRVFLRFLEAELLPELAQQYRTAPYHLLFGHSLGGLLTTYAYLQENSAFHAFLAIDPSLGTWDAPTMDQKLDSLTEAPFRRFFYLASANWGKRNFRNRDRHFRLFDALHSRCPGDFPAQIAYFENENHSSVPIIAFYQGITTLFQDYGTAYQQWSELPYLQRKD